MKKILMVDDQAKIRRLVTLTLKGVNDYAIIEADSGEKAIELARKEKPDLIFMDIMMPGKIDGMEALRLLKEDPETKDITVIMLTAKGQKRDVEMGLENGADDYFVKPFSPMELIQKVEGILGAPFSDMA